jgi:uncharacterized protein
MVRPLHCPICNTTLPATDAIQSQFFPFCTERCRNVDLMRWSDGRYAIVEPLSEDQILELQIEEEGGLSELEDGYD